MMKILLIAVLAATIQLSQVGFAAAKCTIQSVTCYSDNPNQRILGTTNYNDGYAGLSKEWCAQLCHDNHMKLAAVEFGKECYCGNKLADYAHETNQSHCKQKCDGDDRETCGGFDAAEVFEVSCSGTPVPAPARPKYLVNPCLNKTSKVSQMPWCDPTLDINERVKDLISRLTLDEKIKSLDTVSPAIPELGIPAYNWWSEATHGISHVRNDPNLPYESNFAFPITTAMSFNRTLWKVTGNQIATEARAFMNAGDAWSTYWAPVINLAREPRWGRNIETPGEDPYLTGEYATAFVKGFQESPSDPTHLQASACCKHYAANSMENSNVAGVQWTRHNFNAEVTQQDLVDSYLLPFQACVEKGQVSSLMCSYNAINGVPSCANDWLLKEVARKDWGFDGYITSDCDADADVFNSHKYTATPEEAVRDVLRAGTDVDCTSFVGKYAKSALDKKLITESDIDERLSYLFKVRMRLSHFDPIGPLNEIGPASVCSEDALRIAREGSVQGSTLLKNEKETLPLKIGQHNKVAVIGPNALLSKSIAGYYGGNTCGGNYYTMVDAVQQYAAETNFSLGVPSVTSNDVSGIPAAVNLAKSADAVVLVVGTDLSLAREGSDATNLTLSPAQESLISQVVDAVEQKGEEIPVVIVTMTAVPLDISKFLQNEKVGAILHVGQPSVQTLGIGDVLFGKRSPAGRTIQTIYPASYADQISIFDFNMRPGPSAWPRPDCEAPYNNCKNGTNPGRTHRFYTDKPVVPFGFGLSYTNFKYEVVEEPSDSTVSLAKLRELLDGGKVSSISHKALESLPRAGYAINVTNLGNVDSDDVVLGFMAPPGAGTDGIPLQTLFGFERVHVKAGESEIVYLYPELSSFALANKEGHFVARPGKYKVWFGVKEASFSGAGYTSTSLEAF